MKDLKITSNIRVYEYDELPADLLNGAIRGALFF